MISLICEASCSRVFKASCIESSSAESRMRALYEDVGNEGVGFGEGISIARLESVV